MLFAAMTAVVAAALSGVGAVPLTPATRCTQDMSPRMVECLCVRATGNAATAHPSGRFGLAPSATTLRTPSQPTLCPRYGPHAAWRASLTTIDATR